MSPDANEKRFESRAWKTLFCVSLVNSAQAAIAIIGIPSLTTEHSFSSGQLTSLLAALPIGAGVSAALSGPISDRWGRKNTLLFGLTILGLALLPHAFANDFLPLLLLRALAGIGTGVLMGLPSTLLSDSFRKDRQMALSGKTLCGYAIGQTIGIPVGIALIEWTNFLTVCSLFGFLALLCIPFSQKYLPHAPRSQTQGKRSEWLLDYLRRSRETLRDKDFNLIASASFLSFTALSAFYVSFALWLFSTAHMRPYEIAPMYLAGGVLQVIVFTFVLRWISGLRPQLIIFISLILNTVIFSAVYPALTSLESATAFFALTLGAVSLRIPGLQFLINNRGDPKQKGFRVSINQTSSHMGKAFGSILAGSLFPILEMHQIVLSCGVITLICSLLFLRDLMSELNAAQLRNRSGRNFGGETPSSNKNEKKGWLWHARC